MVGVPVWLVWMAAIHLALSFWVLRRWRVERAAAEMFERRWEGLLAEKEAGLDVRGKGVLSGVPCGAPAGRSGASDQEYIHSQLSQLGDAVRHGKVSLRRDMLSQQSQMLCVLQARLRAIETPFEAILSPLTGTPRTQWAKLINPPLLEPAGVYLWRDVLQSGGLWYKSDESPLPDFGYFVFAVPCEPPAVPPEPDGAIPVPSDVRMCDL